VRSCTIELSSLVWACLSIGHALQLCTLLFVNCSPIITLCCCLPLPSSCFWSVSVNTQKRYITQSAFGTLSSVFLFSVLKSVQCLANLEDCIGACNEACNQLSLRSSNLNPDSSARNGLVDCIEHVVRRWGQLRRRWSCATYGIFVAWCRYISRGS
jgi:hypothetical protein